MHVKCFSGFSARTWLFLIALSVNIKPRVSSGGWCCWLEKKEVGGGDYFRENATYDLPLICYQREPLYRIEQWT